MILLAVSIAAASRPAHPSCASRAAPICARARSLEPWIRELAAGCLDAKRDVGELDVVDDFAAQVATKVACEVNGFPKEDGDMLTELVKRFFKRDPEVVCVILTAAGEKSFCTGMDVSDVATGDAKGTGEMDRESAPGSS